MSPWYKKSFNREYLEIYPHRDASEARKDIERIAVLVGLSKDAPILDLACGAGRHLIALHEMGFTRLCGLDLSKELLEEAAENLKEIGANSVELIHGDMRGIPSKDHFAAVLSLFTSFGYFEEDGENRKVVHAAFRCLRFGGIFLIDTLNRDFLISNLVPVDERNIRGSRIQSTRRLTQGSRRVEKTIRITSAQGEEREFHESVRLFSAREMEEMLQNAGFVRIRKYGSLQGDPLTSQSERLVVIGEREGKP